LMNNNNISLLNPEEYLKNIKNRIKELRNIDLGPKRYKQLEQQEETIFQQSKVIIDQNKPARAELVQAYIVVDVAEFG
ncbi:28814_t:CDS:1, partial [Racocetra persica]